MNRDRPDSRAGAAVGTVPAHGDWNAAPRPVRAMRFEARLSAPTMLCLFGLALALALIPVAVVHIPAITDYPFHTARINIIDHWQRWPSLHEFYALRSFVLPNITTDVILLGLVQLMPIEIAGRVLVAITLATLLSGTVALHWSLHRRLSAWPLVAALFLHNWIFVFGFLNYLFGVGLMLWGLAIWIALADRSAGIRFVVGIAIAFAIYFAHMVAFGIYALAVAGYELQRVLPHLRGLRREAIRAALGRLIIGALPFVPPLLVFVLVSPTSGEAGNRIKYMPEWWWKGFVVARSFMSMNLGLDILTVAVLLALAIVVLLRGRLTLARGVLLAIGFVVAAFVVLPWKMFGAVFVDARFPIALFFLMVAALRVGFSGAAVGRTVYAVVALLLIARSVVLANDWLGFDRVFARFEAALSQLPENSIVLSASAAPPPRSLTEWVDRWRPPVTHMASLIQLHKPAFAVNTWATPSQQPIAVMPRWEALYRYQEQNPMPVESADELAAYLDKSLGLIDRADKPRHPVYLLLLYPDYVHYPLPRELTRIDAGRRFLLFRVDR